jgi:hypothetical protein
MTSLRLLEAALPPRQDDYEAAGGGMLVNDADGGIRDRNRLGLDYDILTSIFL